MFIFFHALAFALGLWGGYPSFGLDHSSVVHESMQAAAPDDGGGTMPGDGGGTMPGDSGGG